MQCLELPYCLEIPYLAGRMSLRMPTHSTLQQVNIPATQTLSWHDSASNSVIQDWKCIQIPINFFWLAILLIQVISSPAFTYASWIRVLFNGKILITEYSCHIVVTCRHNLPWQRSFKRWVAVEQLSAWVYAGQHIAPSHFQNVHNQIWYIHS